MVESPEILIEGFCQGKSGISERNALENQETQSEKMQNDVFKVLSETKST